jgi:hypothetical protein
MRYYFETFNRKNSKLNQFIASSLLFKQTKDELIVNAVHFC